MKYLIVLVIIYSLAIGYIGDVLTDSVTAGQAILTAALASK